MTRCSPICSLLTVSVACATPGSSPAADTPPRTTPVAVVEAPPTHQTDAATVAPPWSGDAVLGRSDDTELRAGLHLDGRGVQLYALEGQRMRGPVTISEVPSCDPSMPGASVEHEFETADDARRVEMSSKCTQIDGDGTRGMPGLHEENCELSFEAGPPARWLVECQSYYEGGAHPDVATSRQRYSATQLTPLEGCSDGDAFLSRPLTRERVHEAMRRAGCAPEEFEAYLGCNYEIPHPGGGRTLFLDLYLPRVARADDCDQIELRVELPG